MNSEKQVSVDQKAMAFESRPYGYRFKMSSTTQLVVINPRSTTAQGIETKELDEFGFRPHPKTARETVTFLSFIGETPDDPVEQCALIYRVRRVEENDIVIVLFKPGASFDSVSENGKVGYWHRLENNSDTPIMLLVTVEPLEESQLRK